MAKKLALVNGVPRMVTETALPTIYIADYAVGVGGLTSGTAITLPSSQTYTSIELNVLLNGLPQDQTLGDYNYIGSAPRTQISFNQNLVQGDVVTFTIIRGQ